jgi:Tat protein translocase TatB subunit
MTILGMGPFEILLIMIVALMVFGPQRLPEVAGQVGRTIRDFRRMATDLTTEFHTVTEELTGEFRAAAQDLSDELHAVQDDLSNEVRGVNEALRLDSGTSSIGATSVGHQVAPAYETAATYGTAPATSEAPAMNGHERRTASKDDPRTDVSLFDLDELVVMPRTSRPANGQHAGNGTAPEAQSPAPARQPRSGRRAAAVYHRPRPN